ncbi:Cysteine-rich receptor-like protein kinase 37 [Zea mays]|uniref:Cysteine-rich receptor-like protein kinase 37 n=1 Tax=Zea mays TaxID=4577 RepID=A0A1D6FD66_MAIZE|nr:Cysteine-rich receptor-like protein kinase 37 [Zea mays]
MGMSAASHLCASSSLRALTVLFVLAAFVSDVEGRHRRHVCPPYFSCGGLSNISYPFRRQGDPSGCGVQSYELVCTDTDATIRIGSGTYKVLSINSTYSYFWVVDADLDIQSSCPLPRWDYPARWINRNSHRWRIEFSHYYLYSSFYTVSRWAIFVNCSQPIENNDIYGPVSCLSNSSFIYLLVTDNWDVISAGDLEPSCGYLAKTPLGGPGMTVPSNTSYPDVVKFMRNGFALGFPFSIRSYPTIRECLAENMRTFHKEPRNSTGIRQQILDILTFETLWFCVIEQLGSTNNGVKSVLIDIIQQIPYVLSSLKSAHVICRFVLMPLAVFVFLAYKYWKTQITIDAVEKFLRMQNMLVPMRYAYTNIIAITGHFRDKLGQGGYGTVYKGVLLPGEIHVAVKMLGNSNCNGEEFISEVATIGKIHHVNVVRLIGFCSEENIRALIYEFMPRGSLDKYIFSSEKTFSWDKLNEIALGIARGLNYLHHGCDMQIVHFDIKPHNILLDSNFVPKVADFGLAKLFPRDDSFVPLSAMRGTIGYIAPEMVSRSFGIISSKSDVYSFGMLLLEMTGGRRNADPHAGSSSQAYYPSLVYRQLSQGDANRISEGVDMHELEKKLCIIGLWCIQMKPQDRPTMSEVIEMLEAGVDGIQMPPRPYFCDEEGDSSYSTISELDTIEE